MYNEDDMNNRERNEYVSSNNADLFSDTPDSNCGAFDHDDKPDYISELYGAKKEPEPKKPKIRYSLLFSIIACCIAVVMFVSGLLVGLNSGVKVSAGDYEFLEASRELRSVIDFIKNNYYIDVDEKTLLAYAEYGVVDNLDSFSHVTTLDEVIASTAGDNYKVGIVVDNSVAGEFCISWVVPGSPAEHAGLRIGDKLIAVGYEPDKLYNVEKTYLTTVNALFSAKIKNVYIQIERDGTVLDTPVLVIRSNVNSSSVHAINDFYSTFKLLIPSDIGYIAITDFTDDNIANDLRVALNNFKSSGKKKLILDLRNNGGGYGSVLGAVGSYFIKNEQGEGTTHIINHIYKDGKDNFVDTTGYNYIYKDTGYEYKIAVLVNGGTASASEALVGAMIGANTCELIGETTYGKGVGQLTVSGEWSSVYSITYTAGYYYFLKDVSAYVSGATVPTYNIHGKGFTPHEEYNLAKGKSNILSTDAQFLKAVQYLYNLG